MFPPSNQNYPQVSDPHLAVRTMQIIVGALIMGVVMFAAVAVFMNLQFAAAKQVQAPFPVMEYIGIGFAVLLTGLRFVIPAMIAENAVRSAAIQRGVESLKSIEFYGIYQTTLIIASALLEGAAFFNLIAYLLQRDPLNLGIAGLLVLVMAGGFPTYDRVENWCQDQLRQLQLNPPRM